jgi:hypothetical protein
MSECNICHQDMLTAKGCTATRLAYKQPKSAMQRKERIRYGQERREAFVGVGSDGERCRDCGVHPGHYHHPGCDWEECPYCGGQLLGCFCNDNGVFYDEVVP